MRVLSLLVNVSFSQRFIDEIASRKGIKQLKSYIHHLKRTRTRGIDAGGGI